MHFQRARALSAAVGMVLSLASISCDSGSPEAPPPVPPEVAKEEVAPPPAAKLAVKVVELTKEGSEFDPPIDVAEVPTGAWMCDMGTVHYARLEKGDGLCPVCNMQLIENAEGDHTH